MIISFSNFLVSLLSAATMPLIATFSLKWSGPKLGWHKDDVNPHLAKHADLLFGGSDLCCDDDDDDNNVGTTDRGGSGPKMIDVKGKDYKTVLLYLVVLRA